VRHFPLPGPALAFAQRIDDDLALGASFEPVSGGGGSATFVTGAFPGGERETSNLLVLGLSVGGAFRIRPDLSVGLSLTGLSASLDQKGLVGGSGGGQTAGLVRNFTNGQLDATDPYFRVNGQPISWGALLARAGTPGASSSAIADVSGATGWGGQATLGVAWRLCDEISLGAAYATPGWLTPLEGRATLDASAAGAQSSGALDAIQSDFLSHHLPRGGDLVSRYSARLSGLSLPQTAGVGIAFWPLPSLLLAADLKWLGWRLAFDTVTVHLQHGTGQDLAEITSDQLSSGIRSRVLLRWHDQLALSLGATFAPVEWLRLRVGYHYANDPAPQRTEGPFTPVTVEHHATLGLGLQLGPVSFDAAWIHAFARTTTIERSGVSSDWDGIRHKADQDAFLIGGGVDF